MSTVKCFSYESSEDLNFNNEEIIKASEVIERKFYVEPEAIFITQEGLFLNINGELFHISCIASDEIGIYIPYLGYEPWHDDDWLCPSFGHWNPSYDNRCVNHRCRKPMPRNPRRWKDAHWKKDGCIKLWKISNKNEIFFFTDPYFCYSHLPL